jgi:hypothetical protein
MRGLADCGGTTGTRVAFSWFGVGWLQQVRSFKFLFGVIITTPSLFVPRAAVGERNERVSQLHTTRQETNSKHVDGAFKEKKNLLDGISSILFIWLISHDRKYCCLICYKRKTLSDLINKPKHA